jgi:hypothetical protein
MLPFVMPLFLFNPTPVDYRSLGENGARSHFVGLTGRFSLSVCPIEEGKATRKEAPYFEAEYPYLYSAPVRRGTNEHFLSAESADEHCPSRLVATKPSTTLPKPGAATSIADAESWNRA